MPVRTLQIFRFKTFRGRRTNRVRFSGRCDKFALRERDHRRRVCREDEMTRNTRVSYPLLYVLCTYIYIHIVFLYIHTYVRAR